jgi:hypothetical protein
LQHKTAVFRRRAGLDGIEVLNIVLRPGGNRGDKQRLAKILLLGLVVITFIFRDILISGPYSGSGQQ